jgi:hypothetical protein
MERNKRFYAPNEEPGANGGKTDAPARTQEQEAVTREAGHPGEYGNAAGMDNPAANEQNQKQENNSTGQAD